MSKQPRFLFWVDLETTGLSPREDDILELAYVLTEFAYPYKEVTRGSYLVSSPGRIALLSGQCTDFIQTMHERSGLKESLVVTENTRTLSSVEADLLSLSQDWPLDKDERVVVAGSSVGTFDLQFIRWKLTRFAARLSHRAFDASASKLIATSLGMSETSEGEKKDAAHRALADVEASIVIMRRYIRWLAQPRGTGGKVCTTLGCIGEGRPHYGDCVEQGS